MPRLKLQTLVQGSPEKVFEYVTGYPASGQPDHQALEERYGRLVKWEGDSYTFEENTEEGASWRCAFQPPKRRVMEALESNWADRIDQFENSSGGTLWTVIWESKSRGLASYTQWLFFQLRGKRRVYQQFITPVAQHFQQMSKDSL